MGVLKRTWPLTTVDKLVLSQEDQPQTHRSTQQVSRETGLTQPSVVRIICCDLGLNFLKCPKSRCAHELTAAIVSFTYISVSQGSVATQFRRGEIGNNSFVANFPQSVPVKEFLKSVNIWRRYKQKFGVMFFDSRCSSRHQTYLKLYVLMPHSQFMLFMSHQFLCVHRRNGSNFEDSPNRSGSWQFENNHELRAIAHASFNLTKIF